MRLLASLPVQTLLLLSALLSPASAVPGQVVEGRAAEASAEYFGVVEGRDAGASGKDVKALQGRSPPAVNSKYFNEPGGTEVLGHYDVRFYKALVPYAEHTPKLQHLIRSYLTVFRALGIETWLAHGTLLGWWWNGKIMPWDYDVDVQVSNATLAYLAERHNRTTYTYFYVDAATGAEANKTYLLDVNPHFADRNRGNGQNIIDARWIDMANGMFIDITGLAERDPDRNPGLWSCKNFHRYRTRDLYPMRETEFEGVPATVPYAFEKALIDEYGTKSLVKTEWKE